ncbi:MAG: hypothetical protein ACKVJK_16735 [Methylophagaceae bacterium]|jgi:hypothetical protein|tara:strand:- start:97 stop:309 length:213 start_codon:yes stop_codon:yes gene_type:complete
MKQVDDVHDQLVKAYLAYFSENEKFEDRNSVRTHRSVRKALRDIRTFAKLRADEIHEKHITTRVTHKGDK